MFNFLKRNSRKSVLKIIKIVPALTLSDHAHVYYKYWNYNGDLFEDSLLTRKSQLESDEELLSIIKNHVACYELEGKEFKLEGKEFNLE